MTPTEIKIELLRHNVTQTEIARGCNVSCGHINRVIGRMSVSDHVQRAVAKAIGQPVEKIFPERYPVEKN